MVISPQTAQSIVEETVKIIHRNINFMDEQAQIIASIDPNRIGDFHEGAWTVLKTKEPLIIQEENEFGGAKRGVNLPVELNDQIIGVIGITGKPEEVVQFGEVIKRMTEILLKEAYIEEQIELENRARESFIDEWIEGDWENDKLFAARGWIHKINVHIPRAAVVLEVKDFNDILYEKLKSYEADVKGELEFQQFRCEILNVIQNHFPEQSQHVIIPSGSTRYTMLLSVNEHSSEMKRKEKIRYRLNKIQSAIQTSYKFETTAGIGQMYVDPRSTSHSVREAERALLHAKNRKQTFIFHDELGIESFAYDLSEETREAYIKKVLLNDTGIEHAQMLETLECFFEANGSITEAAEKLFIHKNTLQYRLKRIKEITGYDPRVLTEAVMLYVAMTFYMINNGADRN
ncbi:sugar diacid recognition domain-containing protein [Alkalihalobacillus sp. TS-13]|uniref:CdaR family transcriptional regulator n=1 Tax=Alkalihalobacillus sp. TS-13 TaxID=2842455 RepID=UPI001C8807C2|nr:sugar diacid recognition domain-containing protein [Alkalihalobacillus sp. TS-13]